MVAGLEALGSSMGYSLGFTDPQYSGMKKLMRDSGCFGQC